jgi:hypothetical protein
MSTKWFICIAVAAAFATSGGMPAAASEQQPLIKFDWMANGTKGGSEAERLEQAKEAVRKARALNTGSTWVCSPAGFGKRSQCERG